MEKKTKSIREDLPSSRLYLDDVREIWEIMRATAKDDIRIETNEYLIQALDELETISTRKIHELEMSFYRPFYLSLHLSSTRASVYASTDASDAVGVVQKIKSVIHKRSNMLLDFVLTWKFIWCLILLSWLLSPPWDQISNLAEMKATDYIAAAFTATALILLPFAAWRDWRYSTIILQRREQVGFLRTHWAQIVVGIIVTVIGSLLAAVVLELSKIFLT